MHERRTTVLRRLGGLRSAALLTAATTALMVGAGPAGAVGDPVTFAPQVEYSTGLYPWDVAAADVNGDGRQDMIVVNRIGDSVSILLGNGNGTFRPKVDYSTGDLPFSVAPADLDGDGDIDLVVPRVAADTVAVLLGNGDGSFGAPVDYPTGDSPQVVIVDDVNGNGTADLVTSNWEGGTVSVLPGNGDGTFGARTDFVTGSGPAGLDMADVNGDGHNDLLTANFFASTLSVLLGNGDGTFGAPTDTLTGETPDSLVLADLNADGHLDVVIGNHFVDSVSVLLGNGDGTFGASISYPTGYRTNDIEVLDINSDGMLDVVTCNWGPDQSDPDPTVVGTVSTLLGNGDGTLGFHTDFPIARITPAFAIGDFNADTRPDIAVTNHDFHRVAVLLNTAGNLAPIATGDSYQVPKKGVLTVPAPGVLANDADPEGVAITATLVSGPAQGTLTLDPDGSFTYTVTNKKFQGDDTFTYTVSDGSSASAPATVTLHITK